jgi:CubicO group peptidase (beta-lactamase class C family)
MLLNRGVYKGKRLLSEDAVKQMTTKQTGETVKDEYGLGLSTGGGNYGHGGAYLTNMTVEPTRGLITFSLCSMPVLQATEPRAWSRSRKLPLVWQKNRSEDF